MYLFSSLRLLREFSRKIFGLIFGIASKERKKENGNNKYDLFVLYPEAEQFITKDGDLKSNGESNTRCIGGLGEVLAERYLKIKGYKILDKNYSFRISGGPQQGEIDIIARQCNTISFVEVKTLKHKNRHAYLIRPEDRVNFEKQRKLVRSAESWLIKHKIPLNSKWQIDIIGVEIEGLTVKILHFKNAVFAV